MAKLDLSRFMYIPTVLILTMLSSGCFVNLKNNQMQLSTTKTFDWQGHRGARGLLPENTIPAFLKALEFPISTLELDVAVSKDSQIIVSHEPWMSHAITTKPDGVFVGEEEARSLRIFEMTYQEIKRYDVGQRGNPRFPNQIPMAAHKPSLKDLVLAVRAYCSQEQRPFPRFNIEIKSHPELDEIWTPSPEVFVDLLLKELKDLGIWKQTNLQAFDIRPLQYSRQVAPDMPLALLIENENGIENNIEKLGFIPEIYSPFYLLLSAQNIDTLHQKGMQVIPWTVNDIDHARHLIELGVDGIITDFPDMVLDFE